MRLTPSRVQQTKLAGQNSIRESQRQSRRRWMDRILLLVEVLAIVGLVGVMFNGMSLLRMLNAEVVQAIAQPTLTPTPHHLSGGPAFGTYAP